MSRGLSQRLREDQHGMLIPPDSMKGWKVSRLETICLVEAGFDWYPPGHKPEAGFFGVAPGHLGDEPQCHEIDEGKHPFTNAALTPEGTLGGRDLRLIPRRPD